MQDAANPDYGEEVEPGPFRGRRLKRRIFGGALLFLLALLAVAWWQRVSIADRFVEQELAARGVRATYEIEQIGVRTQRIRNLVIGDPARPDLTARLVELDVALNFTGAHLRDVRADGVRLNGRYANGKLSFGELDKFADPDSKEPFEWPDIGLAVTDAKAHIDTPWGTADANFSGQGLLRNRFAADLTLQSPKVAVGGCTAPEVRFDGKLLLEWRQPRLVGPVSAASLVCGQAGLDVAAPVLVSDVRLSRRFDKWLGDVNFAARKIGYDGSTLIDSAGNFSVDGGFSRTNFTFAIDRAGLKSGPLSARRFAVNAKGYAGKTETGFGASLQGDARIVGGSLKKGTLGSLQGLAAQMRDTPIGPLLARMAPVLERTSDNFSASLNFDAFRDFQGRSGATIGGLAFDSASGARIRQSGALIVESSANGWRLASPARLQLNGRDLPQATLALSQGQASWWQGKLAIAPYTARDASLAVSDFSFAGTPGNAWTFAGTARLSGPLPGGTISGLRLPLSGRYDRAGLSLYDGCQTMRFDNLRMSTLDVKGAAWRLCPDAGRSMLTIGPGGTRFAATMPGFAARGMLGSTPVAANSASLRFTLGEGFAARDVKVLLGGEASQTDFTIAMLAGQFGAKGMSGMLQGASGQIANVPLLIDDAAGNWRYLNNVLTLDGDLRVLDAASTDRFQPMRVPDLMLNLENGIISAIGQLTEPKSGRKVADIDIRHTLASGTGRALLSVDGLRFDERLQPEALTPLTLGVVANVDGAVFGDGRIEWSGDGVRSTGRFATRGMNLAAAFGPVEGLTTEIAFTDLLGLETEPGQMATVASVNPGIPALDGRITYRLLPGQRVAIEAGRWPFAGGELILEPTVLDFGVEKERRLTFRVIGLDAEKFLAGYDFQNLRVSGVFDGTLPMIFDQDGGRIVGGALVSRPGGGEVSYLGELAYEDMGVFANYAFQALRSIRYSSLTIGVGGDLGGEIVTDISFTGLQQGSAAKRNFITKQLARIPIKFNVSITAEFLKLIGSIRGLYDAEYAAQRDLPFLLEQQQGIPPVDEATPVKDETSDE